MTQEIEVQGAHIEALATQADMVTVQVRFCGNTLMSEEILLYPRIHKTRSLLASPYLCHRLT